jgi:hypothetical protein
VIDYGLARSIRAKPVYSPRTAYTSMGVAVTNSTLSGNSVLVFNDGAGATLTIGGQRPRLQLRLVVSKPAWRGWNAPSP